jgi:hypothetical protein
VLWCGLGKSPRLACVRGSPVRYVIGRAKIYRFTSKYRGLGSRDSSS